MQMQSLSGGCRWRGLVRRHAPPRSILRAAAQAHLLQSRLGFAPRSAQRSSANQLGAKPHNSRLIDFEHHHHDGQLQAYWLRRLRSVKPDGFAYLAVSACRAIPLSTPRGRGYQSSRAFFAVELRYTQRRDELPARTLPPVACKSLFLPPRI
jgi:hypothetical protein